MTAYRPFLGTRGAVIHDALAAMLAVDRSLGGGIAERPVRVELRGEHTRGATLWDRRRSPDEDPRPKVRVATGRGRGRRSLDQAASTASL